MAQPPTPHLGLALGGELNIFTAAAIRAQLLDALDAAAEVDVDLAQVTEIDSAGVQLLIAAKKEAATREKAIRFSGHSPAVLDMLDFLDLTAHLGDPVLLHSAT